MPATAAYTVSASCGRPDRTYVTLRAALASTAAVLTDIRDCAAAYGSSSATAKQLMAVRMYAALCSKCSATLKRPVLASSDSTGLLATAAESVWNWWWPWEQPWWW